MLTFHERPGELAGRYLRIEVQKREQGWYLAG
jgi:hypothetical protein